MLIDTHCHLDDSRFDEDLEDVIRRANSNGVEGILIPGADPSTLGKAQSIAHKYDGVFYAAGVHPYDIDKYDEEHLLKYLEDPKCIAVGECGLDYYRLPKESSLKEQEVQLQKRVFIAQIELAKRVKKPLIVHIRESSVDSKKLLLEYGAKDVGGVLHCYNANEELLTLCEENFYFGIGGVLTFKNAKKLPAVLPKIPLEKILLETDAPYLAPHPYRGKRNEPAYIRLVIEKISDILSMPISELEKIFEQNSKRVFKEFGSA